MLALVSAKKGVAGRKPATYLEVARLAKVSPATVTRIAAGSAGVSKEVSLRVRRAAAKLGTDLDRKKRTRIVAFLLSNRDVLHPFQGHILLGAEAYCAADGWEMLFLSFRYPLFGDYAEIQLPQIVGRRDLLRGIILGGTNSASLLRTLKKQGMPFAVLGNNVVGDWEPADCDVVSSDDVNGAYETHLRPDRPGSPAYLVRRRSSASLVPSLRRGVWARDGRRGASAARQGNPYRRP